ncbi:exonuclease domain-containing protein [Paraburkholderia sp. EG287A]|uniref:exonuclease domain-containing protein n=1 Tax=Paraburkholderia sp. EG287A TaxID=3237012 RepID=UPI0034D1DB93
MSHSDLADSELAAELAVLRKQTPALDEYMRRQDSRVARQREVTRHVLEVVASPFVPVIDLEATCYGNSSEAAGYANEVIEVGWALLEPRTGAVVQTEQFYVKPTTSFVSDFCTELTGIRPEQVEYAPSFGDVMRKVGALHAELGVRVWGSYGHYDRAQLERQCATEGVEYPFAGQTHLNIKEVLGAYLGFGKKSPGLARALERVGLEFEGQPHCGVDDARNTARLLAHVLGKPA